MMTNKTEVYVHIPFCRRKCAYCDFVSLACTEDVQKAYFEALHRQIDIKAEFTGKIPVDSVFLGGGTPSLVDAGLITEVLNHLREVYIIEADAEITIEMNPNSVTRGKLLQYKNAGINRLSIGLQSASNEELKLLSRLHNYEEFLETFSLARETGFDNINVDIMSALPGQTRESYRDTLEKVCDLNPEHISAYSLIIEEGTPFYEIYAGGNGLPDEDTEREMYYDTRKILREHGYERYEISNYCRPGKECRHNVGYWVRKPYIGFGIAAASLYNEKRMMMHSDLDRYISGDFEEEVNGLSVEDRMEEFMFLGLRLTRGVSEEEFVKCFGKRHWYSL